MVTELICLLTQKGPYTVEKIPGPVMVQASMRLLIISMLLFIFAKTSKTVILAFHCTLC